MTFGVFRIYIIREIGEENGGLQGWKEEKERWKGGSKEERMKELKGREVEGVRGSFYFTLFVLSCFLSQVLIVCSLFFR